MREIEALRGHDEKRGRGKFCTRYLDGGGQSALCSSQMDSLGTALSIHGGLYTCGVFVLLCLFTKSAMYHLTIAGTGWSVHKGLGMNDVIPQQARWSVRR